jgi:hypothetical protein
MVIPLYSLKDLDCGYHTISTPFFCGAPGVLRPSMMYFSNMAGMSARRCFSLPARLVLLAMSSAKLQKWGMFACPPSFTAFSFEPEVQSDEN